MAGVNVWEAKKTDVKKIYELMQQQATEQNTVLPSHLTCEALTEASWGEDTVLGVFLAESKDTNKLAGYILTYRAYSTWEGRGVYIKELYVVPAARRSGVAVQLCKALLQAAVRSGCTRCDVRLNRANTAAVSLFEKLGAENLTDTEDWHLFYMDSERMTKLKTKCEGQGTTQVRRAHSEDMPGVMAMIQELADYEEMSDGPKINAQTLGTDYWPLGAFFEIFVAESDGALVGYVLPYHTFSCQGRGIYMEDLYVKPTHRCQGVGTALMARVAQRGLTLGAGYLEFSVLAWNTPSITFYQHKGATDITTDKGVLLYRFDDSAMKKCVE